MTRYDAKSDRTLKECDEDGCLEALRKVVVPSAERFGLWDAIIAEPLPDNPGIYPTGTATAHYARGIAFASQGLIAQAEEEQVGEQALFAWCKRARAGVGVWCQWGVGVQGHIEADYGENVVRCGLNYVVQGLKRLHSKRS